MPSPNFLRFGRPMIAPTFLRFGRSMTTNADVEVPSPMFLRFGRPMIAPTFATPQSFHDSSPQGAPFMPLLEERWHAVTEWWQTISRHTSYVLLTYPL